MFADFQNNRIILEQNVVALYQKLQLFMGIIHEEYYGHSLSNTLSNNHSLIG